MNELLTSQLSQVPYGLGGRLARTIGLAILLGFAALALSQMLRADWWLQDGQGYWEAAMRLRHGAELYPFVSNPDASDVYKYAPWFAYAWLPLTFLPKAVAMGAWLVAELAAVVVCVLPALRLRTLAGAATALFGVALLLPAAATGNVQPLLVAALIYGAERASGPFWIAAAASLKAMPLALVMVYVGRREWRRAAATLVLTGILVAPMLLFDLSNYPFTAGAAVGPVSEIVMGGLALLAVGVTLRVARGPYGWLAGAVVTVLAAPRWSYYVPSFLLVGLAPQPTRPTLDR